MIVGCVVGGSFIKFYSIFSEGIVRMANPV